MKNFIITSTGRTATNRLANIMNRSKFYTVEHEPHHCKVQSDRDIYMRFAKHNYGEVNPTVKGQIMNISGKKGIIIRNINDVIVSFLNRRSPDQYKEKINEIFAEYILFNYLIKITNSINDPKNLILVIDYDLMTTDINYLQAVIIYFGIEDVEIIEKDLKEKVNTNKKVKYKNYNNLPLEIKDYINAKMVNYLSWNNRDFLC